MSGPISCLRFRQSGRPRTMGGLRGSAGPSPGATAMAHMMRGGPAEDKRAVAIVYLDYRLLFFLNLYVANGEIVDASRCSGGGPPLNERPRWLAGTAYRDELSDTRQGGFCPGERAIGFSFLLSLSKGETMFYRRRGAAHTLVQLPQGLGVAMPARSGQVVDLQDYRRSRAAARDAQAARENPPPVLPGLVWVPVYLVPLCVLGGAAAVQ